MVGTYLYAHGKISQTYYDVTIKTEDGKLATFKASTPVFELIETYKKFTYKIDDNGFIFDVQKI